VCSETMMDAWVVCNGATVQPFNIGPLSTLSLLQRKGLTSEDAESETLMVITNRSSPSHPTTTRYTLGGWPGFRLAVRHGRAGATSICEQLARVQGRIGACFVRASRGQQGVWDASVRYPRTRPTHEQTSCRARRRRPRRCATVCHARNAMVASFDRGSKDKGLAQEARGHDWGCRWRPVPTIYSWLWAKFARPALIRQKLCIGCDACCRRLTPCPALGA
jgi:hypothetical protein